VSKIASKVEVKEETLRKAIEILGDADRLKIMIGKDPMGLAAAALYLAYTMNGENHTQKDIACAAEVTVRCDLLGIQKST
jgi:transcription initiation factor TFIIB